MKIRYSRRALSELGAILSELAANNSSAAVRFEERISQIEDRLSRFPEGFQEVEQRPGVRRVPAKSRGSNCVPIGCKQ